MAQTETLVALESAGLPSPTGAPTDGSPEPTPEPSPEPTPEPTIFTVDDDGVLFADDYKTQKGAKTHAGGFYYKILEKGDKAGESPDLYTTTGTHYEGRLAEDYPNGPTFDSSYKRGEIAEFKPAQVISCWKYALQDMRPGDVWELVCPPETAYGKKGSPSGAIDGGATLVFTVELVWVGSAPSPTRAPGSDDFLIDALFDDAVGSFDRTPTKRPTLRPNGKTPRPVAAPGDDGDDDLVMSASADLEDLFSNTFVLGVTIWAAVTFCALGYFVYLKMKAKDEKPAAPVQAEARAVGPGEGDAAVEAEAVPSTPLVSEARRRQSERQAAAPPPPGPRATVLIDGPSLGLAFGPDGRIRGVQPGGEGEAKGLAVGDRVVRVGEKDVDSDAAIRAAVGAHAERPLALTVEKPPPKERVAVTIDGPSLGLAFGSDGAVRGVQPGGEGEAKGIKVGEKVVKVGDVDVASDAAIRGAIGGHPERPLVITIERYAVAEPKPPKLDPARDLVPLTFEGPTLGIAFCPNGTPGMLQPGGEAETLGLQYSDKVVKVGDVWCEGEDEIKAAVAAHPQRPITITVARKKPKRAEPDEDPKRERVPLTFEGPTLGIAFCPNGTPGMLQPGGEAETLGLQYSDKVIKVGDTWCEGEDEIKAAVAAHPDRPITIVVARKLPPSLVFGEVSQGPIIEQRDTDGDLDEIVIEYLDDDLERA